jgi:UDP-N-acetyl-alpha-D-muramoyl-L-alanyl-L-glutamate epimerase
MSLPPRFEPASVGAFRVTDRVYDRASRTLVLRYRFDEGPSFEETITFETPPTGHPTTSGPGFGRALLHLHIAAGTSYYKAAAPATVLVEGEALSPAETEFHRHLYDDGLREFAVTNRLPVPRPVTVRSLGPPAPAHAHVPALVSADRPGGVVVPIGGGKDSMVLITALAELSPRLFAVNPHPRVVALAGQTGLDLVVIRRRLSSNLTELNRAGALNGHVPITAIVSLIAVVGSFIYGYDTIAMAVERSASEETVMVDGVAVNHQYSKSAEFEAELRALVASAIDPSVTYGSALRPYSELAIARSFSRLTQFHATFCSCNTIFRQTAEAEDGWCGDCPKCRFVALMLAPFLDPAAVTAIIGRDLFADPGQTPGFAALMSDQDKPFECVGERRETAAALRILASRPEWRDAPVVRALAARSRSLVSEAEVTALLTPSDQLAFADPVVAERVARQLAGPR